MLVFSTLPNEGKEPKRVYFCRNDKGFRPDVIFLSSGPSEAWLDDNQENVLLLARLLHALLYSKCREDQASDISEGKATKLPGKQTSTS